jgi:hypothetical protein
MKALKGRLPETADKLEFLMFAAFEVVYVSGGCLGNRMTLI